ncbi:hypothetical protein LTR74_018987, partial [Friedmanniomyces endolithicus]
MSGLVYQQKQDLQVALPSDVAESLWTALKGASTIMGSGTSFKGGLNEYIECVAGIRLREHRWEEDMVDERS